MTEFLRGIGLDRYDLNARLRPALFVLLPVLVTALFWLPQVRTFAGAIVSFLSACGVLYFLSQAARQRGRAVERKLGDRVGRAHSARMLTHADDTINVETKGRYYTYLRSHGRVLSTPDEEIAAPREAVDRARGAIDWLLEHTRPAARTSLLFDENIAYGFRRNLYGMKPIALALCVLVFAIHSSLLWVRPVDPDIFWTGVVLLIALPVFATCWLFLVTKSFVEDASQSYGLRLFSFCEDKSIATKTPKRRTAAKKTSSPENHL
jgi:hypothetical protein